MITNDYYQKSLWRDEAGAIISTELVLVAVVSVFALIAGFTSMRDAMVSELSDASGSIDEMNQSYSYNGLSVVRNVDGSFTVDTSHPPINEGEELDIPDPITHTVSDFGTIQIEDLVTGFGGSATGTLTAADGTETGFTTTTDTGQVLGQSGNSIAFRESSDSNGIFTTTFDAPIADLELFIGGLFGGPDENVIGNFTVTLSDGTVLNNAAFSIVNDAITANGPVGQFTASAFDSELLSAVNIGGNNYVQDATNNGVRNQAAGRIIFTDIPDPGPHCVGIESVSFERRGGPANFTAFMSFGGSVIVIDP